MNHIYCRKYFRFYKYFRVGTLMIIVILIFGILIHFINRDNVIIGV